MWYIIFKNVVKSTFLVTSFKKLYDMTNVNFHLWHDEIRNRKWLTLTWSITEKKGKKNKFWPSVFVRWLFYIIPYTVESWLFGGIYSLWLNCPDLWHMSLDRVTNFQYWRHRVEPRFEQLHFFVALKHAFHLSFRKKLLVRIKSVGQHFNPCPKEEKRRRNTHTLEPL